MVPKGDFGNYRILEKTWIIEETGLETIGHVQCIVHADWLRAFSTWWNLVEIYDVQNGVEMA